MPPTAPSALPPDIAVAISARVTARIEAARRRRADRDAFQRAHVERRRYGKAALHAVKLARQAAS